MRTLFITMSLVPAILGAQTKIPVVDLPEATTRTAERLGAVLGIRQTAEGKVLVNDALRRQILLFDTTLTNRVIVMDSVAGTSTSYGPYPTPLIPYRGDSSIFAEWLSRTVLVLDGRGRIARTMALPRVEDIVALASASSGFDARGGLVFQGGRPEASRPSPALPGPTDLADSVPILRADFDARRVDTVGRIARPVMKVTTQKTSGGTLTTIYVLDPLQAVDEWAVLSNGSVALVRGHDYHVDWINVDGSKGSSAKLPFDWKRLTEADKQRMNDSVRVVQDSLLAHGYPSVESMVRGPLPCVRPDDGRGAGDVARDPGRGGRGGGGAGQPMPPPPSGGCFEHVKWRAPLVGVASFPRPALPPLADLSRANPIPDYAPPLRLNATIADMDGNMWILPTTTTLSRHGELVYDVVSSNGELIERVRLPMGRAIAGFAKGGVVYLTSGDLASGYTLERTRLATPKR